MPWEASSYTERSPHLGSDSPHPPTGSAHADHPRRKYLLVQLSTALGPPASPDPTRNGHSFPSCRRPTVTRRGSPGPGLPSRPWTARSGPRHVPSPLLRPERWTERQRACWKSEHRTQCSKRSLTNASHSGVWSSTDHANAS